VSKFMGASIEASYKTPFNKLRVLFTADIGRIDSSFHHTILGWFHSIITCTIRVVCALYFSTLMVFPIVLNIIWLRRLKNRIAPV